MTCTKCGKPEARRVVTYGHGTLAAFRELDAGGQSSGIAPAKVEILCHGCWVGQEAEDLERVDSVHSVNRPSEYKAVHRRQFAGEAKAHVI